MTVHPTAVVESGAKLADGVAVAAYAVIGSDVELAEGVQIGPHVVLQGRTFVGARTRVFAHACLGAEPQVRGFEDASSELRIGEDNVFREHVTVHRATGEGDAATRIGDRNYFMNGSHVAHDCQVGSDCVLASFSGLAGHVRIDDHAVLGAYTGVHQHGRVGESAMTASGAKLSKDAPPFSLVAGDRARLVGLNLVGLRRRGFAPTDIRAIKHAYRLLRPSESGANASRLPEVLAAIESEGRGSIHVRTLVDFIRDSERGVCR